MTFQVWASEGNNGTMNLEDQAKWGHHHISPHQAHIFIGTLTEMSKILFFSQNISHKCFQCQYNVRKMIYDHARSLYCVIQFSLNINIETCRPPATFYVLWDDRILHVMLVTGLLKRKQHRMISTLQCFVLSRCCTHEMCGMYLQLPKPQMKKNKFVCTMPCTHAINHEVNMMDQLNIYFAKTLT